MKTMRIELFVAYDEKGRAIGRSDREDALYEMTDRNHSVGLVRVVRVVLDVPAPEDPSVHVKVPAGDLVAAE